MAMAMAMLTQKEKSSLGPIPRQKLKFTWSTRAPMKYKLTVLLKQKTAKAESKEYGLLCIENFKYDRDHRGIISRRLYVINMMNLEFMKEMKR